mmetsp:Transcript_29520/g.100356  ORF Transcript_29520/g.100356 Transcript_29520/m.100356 type:complete len:202 (-) Transcript_29520:32-637(-)
MAFFRMTSSILMSTRPRFSVLLPATPRRLKSILTRVPRGFAPKTRRRISGVLSLPGLAKTTAPPRTVPASLTFSLGAAASGFVIFSSTIFRRTHDTPSATVISSPQKKAGDRAAARAQAVASDSALSGANLNSPACSRSAGCKAFAKGFDDAHKVRAMTWTDPSGTFRSVAAKRDTSSWAPKPRSPQRVRAASASAYHMRR